MHIQKLEEMSSFFDKRAETYDNHMLTELDLKVFYSEIAKCIPLRRDNVKILDLGCGTGLELERFFAIYPNAQVTGVDLSAKMLEILKEKFVDKDAQLNLICRSYFDMDFGAGTYDFVLSTYTLHHFSAELKLELYKKIYNSLKYDGLYIEGDYTVKSKEKEILYLAENNRIRKENGYNEGLYHYDTPLSIHTQIDLLREAGFSEVKLQKEWENTSIFVCRK